MVAKCLGRAERAARWRRSVPDTGAGPEQERTDRLTGGACAAGEERAPSEAHPKAKRTKAGKKDKCGRQKRQDAQAAVSGRASDVQKRGREHV